MDTGHNLQDFFCCMILYVIFLHSTLLGYTGLLLNCDYELLYIYTCFLAKDFLLIFHKIISS